MIISHKLTKGILLKRYKRFLTDIQLDDEEIITAHCPNSGSMLTCSTPGSPVLLSRSNNPKRKYPYTWELIYSNGGWVGINTQLTNQLVKEAIIRDRIHELRGYTNIKSEVHVGENSRLDLLLSNEDDLCYVEVKNVTLVVAHTAYFPDAVTIRGLKHLNELINLRKAGYRTVTFYLIQRTDCGIFKPAYHIDLDYGKALKKAISCGVEALVYQASIIPPKIKVSKPIPLEF